MIGKVLDVLRSHAFTFTTERDLQDGMAEAFADAGLPMTREVRLSRGDRIDFLIGSVGVEVKTNGGWQAVTKQCQRYAASERVTELVIVTSKAAHLACPNWIGGKPLVVHFLGGMRL